MSNKITKEHVGKRVLANLSSNYPTRPTIELQVLEISPSSDYIKFKYLSGHDGWEYKDKYDLVEVLDSPLTAKELVKQFEEAMGIGEDNPIKKCDEYSHRVHVIWVGRVRDVGQAMEKYENSTKDGEIVCKGSFFPKGIPRGDLLIVYLVDGYLKLPDWPVIEKSIFGLRDRGVIVIEHHL